MFRIPITRETFDRVLSVTSLESIGKGLSVPELASLLFVQKLADCQGGKDDQVQRTLSGLIEALKPLTPDQLARLAVSRLAPDQLQRGQSLLREASIATMSAEEVKSRHYLDREGGWNWSYQASHSDLVERDDLQRHFSRQKRFTPDQGRLFAEFVANPGESLDLYGYAGTGKTLTISNMIETLDTGKVLLCAMNRMQLQSLAARVNASVYRCTFGQLAISILESNRLDRSRRGGSRYKKFYMLSYDEIANKMGYPKIGSCAPKWVAFNVVKTVNRFCYSSDSQICDKHIPTESYITQPADRAAIRELAEQFWRETITPRPNDSRPLPVREYHRIKHLSLLEDTIPDHFTHVFFDEAHDLSQPVLQILDRSPQAVITMGDKYQALGSFTVPPGRSDKIRKRHMGYSFRAGDNASDLYNGVLKHHPVQLRVPFEGARTKKTEIVRYDTFSFPDDYCTVLANSSWQAFAMMQRLAHASAPFAVLPRTLQDIKYLIGEAIELFYRRSSRSTHPELREFKSWKQFMKKHPEDPYGKLDTLFRKGYDVSDFERTVNQARASGDNVYIVGRIEDAKNMEFDRVALLPDILVLPDNTRGGRVGLINRLYTGLSRAKRQLVIPGYIEDWLADACPKTGKLPENR